MTDSPPDVPRQPPLAPPPRHLPTSLRLRVKNGSTMQTIGWLVLAFSGFLATVFVGNSGSPKAAVAAEANEHRRNRGRRWQ